MLEYIEKKILKNGNQRYLYSSFDMDVSISKLAPGVWKLLINGHPPEESIFLTRKKALEYINENHG